MVVLIYISLMTNDILHFFMCLLVIHGLDDVCLDIPLLLFSGLIYFLIFLVIYLMVMINNILITFLWTRIDRSLKSFFSAFTLTHNYYFIVHSLSLNYACIFKFLLLNFSKSYLYFLKWSFSGFPNFLWLMTGNGHLKALLLRLQVSSESHQGYSWQ